MADGEERIHMLRAEIEQLRTENQRLGAEIERLYAQRYSVFEMLMEAHVKIMRHNTVRGMGLIGEAMAELKTVRNP